MILPQAAISNAFLQRWMDENGRVDYEGLKTDESLRQAWIFIENIDMSGLNYEEEFAFWLNAYNLLTIKGVLKELEKNPHWRGNMTLWSKIRFFFLRKFNVGGRRVSLYAIENKILRKRFKDPRIHFAINCASASCPILPPELFTSANLESLLEQLTHSFINDPCHVKYDEEANSLWLNPIFKWYKKDFRVTGGVLEFIKRYHESSKIKALSTVNIKYMKYDWSLNAKK